MEDIDVEIDPYADLKQHCVSEVQAIVPRKIQKRRQHFVKVPMVWVERLAGAFGNTWVIAMHLLYLHWKDNGKPIKLANGMLKSDGISRYTKHRSLADLERRGLIEVERRPRRSPLVKLVLGTLV